MVPTIAPGMWDPHQDPPTLQDSQQDVSMHASSPLSQGNRIGGLQHVSLSIWIVVSALMALLVSLSIVYLMAPSTQ